MAEQRKPHTRRPSCRHVPGRVRPRRAFYYTYPRAPTYISPENYRQREEFTYYAASAVGYVRPLPSLRFCTFRPQHKTDVVLGKKNQLAVGSWFDLPVEFHGRRRAAGKGVVRGSAHRDLFKLLVTVCR